MAVTTTMAEVTETTVVTVAGVAAVAVVALDGNLDRLHNLGTFQTLINHNEKYYNIHSNQQYL